MRRERARGSDHTLERCTLPLARQVEGRDRATVRRGEHPRDSVHRLDLATDEELDRLRATFPDAGEAALDGAVLLEQLLEDVLAARGLNEEVLGKLPSRPILATFACLACGATTAARTSRDWAIDRAMRTSGLPEREIQRVAALLREVFGADQPRVDHFDRDVLAELAGLVDQDVDHETLRNRLVVRRREPHPARSDDL